MATNTPRPKITHVLFDMDGLLLNTEEFYTVVQQNIAADYGKEFTWELKSKLLGLKAIEAARLSISELGLKGQLEPEEFLEKREAALDLLFPSSELLPGAERLIRHLHQHGIPACLATSSNIRGYAKKTTNHGALFSLFTHKVTGDEVAQGKPHPEIFLAAAARFTPPATPSKSCLVFEDAPAGIQAASAAGMSSIMVPHPSLPRELCVGADQCLTSLTHFVPEEWGLPPYDNVDAREG
ncbi:hypothetical protein ACKKBF_B01750 [Auxenochlorella protothecoides x Auxenochlorella symbiontica]